MITVKRFKEICRMIEDKPHNPNDSMNDYYDAIEDLISEYVRLTNLNQRSPKKIWLVNDMNTGLIDEIKAFKNESDAIAFQKKLIANGIKNDLDIDPDMIAIMAIDIE